MKKSKRLMWLGLLVIFLGTLACTLPFTSPLLESDETQVPSEGSQLGPGEVIFGPEDIALGATDGALANPISIDFKVVENPIEYTTLPRGAKQESSFYFITATEDVYPATDAPFIFGLPVPEGVPVDQLALATTIRSEELDGFQGEVGDEDDFDDIFESEPKLMWHVLTGRYDEENNLFLVPFYSLSMQGRTVVLISGEQFSSPLASLGAEEASRLTNQLAASVFTFPDQFRHIIFSSDVGNSSPVSQIDYEGFLVECIGYDKAELSICDNQTQVAIDLLDQAYQDYVGQWGFNGPFLKGRIEVIDLIGGDSPMIVHGLFYVVQIRKPLLVDENPNRCEYTAEAEKTRDKGPLSGVYLLSEQTLAFCIADPKDDHFSDGKKLSVGNTLARHELFHALQYAYPEYRANTKTKQRELSEGSAVAAVLSNQMTMIRRSSSNARKIDVPLFRTPSERDRVAYLSQDFWVFVGKRFNVGISYLPPILELGGLREDVDNSFDDQFGMSLGDVYWEWVKNQAFEKTYDIGSSGSGASGFLGTSCQFNSATAKHTRIIYKFIAPPDSISINLQPLNSHVVRIIFKAVPDLPYSLQIEASSPSSSFKAKIYDSDDAVGTTCQNAPDAQSASIQVLASQDKVYYVLLSNPDLHNELTATLSFGTEAGLVIVSPDQNSHFDEGDTIPLGALVTGFEGEDADQINVIWTYQAATGIPTTIGVSDNGELLDVQNLCDGNYQVTAKALDAGSGQSFVDTVSFIVNDLGSSNPPAHCAPSITIVSPSGGSKFIVGDQIFIQAIIDDDHPETDEPLYPIIWRADGPNGRIIGRGLETSIKMGETTSQIYVEYGSANDSVNVQVVDTPNKAPIPIIDAPSPNEYFQENASSVSVSLVGDTEEGNLPGSQLNWSYINETTGESGNIGSGKQVNASFPIFSCVQERMIIILEVKDSEGLTGITQVEIWIQGPLC